MPALQFLTTSYRVSPRILRIVGQHWMLLALTCPLCSLLFASIRRRDQMAARWRASAFIFSYRGVWIWNYKKSAHVRRPYLGVGTVRIARFFLQPKIALHSAPLSNSVNPDHMRFRTRGRRGGKFLSNYCNGWRFRRFYFYVSLSPISFRLVWKIPKRQNED